jgi:hypothetical protein
MLEALGLPNFASSVEKTALIIDNHSVKVGITRTAQKTLAVSFSLSSHL